MLVWEKKATKWSYMKLKYFQMSLLPLPPGMIGSVSTVTLELMFYRIA